MGPRAQSSHCHLQIDFYSTLVLGEIPRKIVLFVLEPAVSFSASDSPVFNWVGEPAETEGLSQDAVCFARGILATA